MEPPLPPKRRGEAVSAYCFTTWLGACGWSGCEGGGRGERGTQEEEGEMLRLLA
jgi:hypothetical protein